jgi:hypothetical protein
MPWVIRETHTRHGRLKRMVQDWSHEHGGKVSTWVIAALFTTGAAIYIHQMGYLWWLGL